MHTKRKAIGGIILGVLLLCWMPNANAQDAPQIAQNALDSTVLLVIESTKGKSMGSGFIIRKGHIATNYHVIKGIKRGKAKRVGAPKEYAIEAIEAVDKERDLAIVQITSVDAPALPLGDSDTVQVGESVYVAGNPQGLEGTISNGIISAIRPEGNSLVDGKILQITAPISPGSSGGPVLSDKGKVIGVSVGGHRDGQNLNFAIPINYLKTLMGQGGSRTPLAQAESNDGPSIGALGEHLSELGLTIIELLAILVISTIPLILIIIAMPDSRGRSGVLKFLSCCGLIIISLIMMGVTWLLFIKTPTVAVVVVITLFLVVSFFRWIFKRR
ncbi:hypothetical protein C6499_19290 [Candidatus Poribacteria bacterium]|nr:MAG: hypothetical protein C6499_19290 [Candidatus Poribacteria bacterium]